MTITVLLKTDFNTAGGATLYKYHILNLFCILFFYLFTIYLLCLFIFLFYLFIYLFKFYQYSQANTLAEKQAHFNSIKGANSMQAANRSGIAR